MSDANKALAEVRGWLCDNLSNGDAGKVCGMLSVVSRRISELEEENAKLRDYLLANSNPTAAELRRVRSAWKKDRDENAKLREMVRDMFEEIDVYGLDAMYEEDPSWRVGIRELGIEVD